MAQGVKGTRSGDTERRHNPDGNICWHWIFHALTCDQYDDMRKQADYRCEICGVHESTTRRKRLVIDHLATRANRGRFHARGLLCPKCNTFMAKIDGNMNWGKSPTSRIYEAKALAYLENSWSTPDGYIREGRLFRPADEIALELPAVPIITPQMAERVTFGDSFIVGCAKRRAASLWVIEVGTDIIHVPASWLTPVESESMANA